MKSGCIALRAFRFLQGKENWMPDMKVNENRPSLAPLAADLFYARSHSQDYFRPPSEA
jgi:hypothetical protein